MICHIADIPKKEKV